tara:strand:- start:355 stop:513 length:159 start_codon:yes stop_codon:yes gene_type:complete
MMKQHKRHFEIAALAASNTSRNMAVTYLRGLERAAMSNRALKEIQIEIKKYL